ncbi:hypothetical protein EZV62_013484 [Acer yangbiense]|uniref:YqgF/RNase H-like domain-containing protein n=1 Tax=Acer yangbiense TaxID=1000413 RepID=A0A5C7HYB8_9ROSI|nr:hypothetical protein EZV62_013484 [Acer yangbiense]
MKQTLQNKIHSYLFVLVLSMGTEKKRKRKINFPEFVFGMRGVGKQYKSLLGSNKYLLKKKLPTLCSVCVDTGTKYIDFSVSDTDLTCSSPLMTYVLGEHETPQMFGQLIEKLIRTKNVGGLVVGYSAAVKESERADHEAQIMKFLDLLFESGYLRGFPFTLVDESGSLKNAFARLQVWVFHERWLTRVNNYMLHLSPSDVRREKKLQSFGNEWNRSHWV